MVAMEKIVMINSIEGMAEGIVKGLNSTFLHIFEKSFFLILIENYYYMELPLTV